MSTVTNKTPERIEKGPIIYKNWNAQLQSKPYFGSEEYPLYSDVHLTGDLIGPHGPYKIINTFSIPYVPELLQRLVLRIDNHLERDVTKYDSAKTNVTYYHGGTPSEEIAALISICLGIKLKSGGVLRHFSPEGDPKGEPSAVHTYDKPILRKPVGRDYILPYALEEKSLSNASLIARFIELKPLDAVALIKTARLYQDALWISESHPEISWILLVSSVETAAGYWRKSVESELERLKLFKPELIDLLQARGGAELVNEVAKLIADYMGATKTFIAFLMEFLPEPPKSRPKHGQIEWNEDTLRKSFQIIYNWRSKALHGGIPFPLPMCRPPRKEGKSYWEKPIGLATHGKGATWNIKDTPMHLNTFEYIARNAIINWWKSMLSATENFA